eukprot:1900993-Rhodomonas_salina.1
MGCIRHCQQQREHQPCIHRNTEACWCEREQQTKQLALGELGLWTSTSRKGVRLFGTGLQFCNECVPEMVHVPEFIGNSPGLDAFFEDHQYWEYYYSPNIDPGTN